MILPALLVSAQLSLAVTELPEPSANRIHVEIVAGLDQPDRKEWAAANVLREVLTSGTAGFTAMQLLIYATQAGDPIKVTLAADHLRISYSVLPTDLKLAAQIADDLVRDANLSESSVKTSLDEMPFRRRSPWSEVWQPLSVDAKGVTREDVIKLYRKIFQPGNVSIALAGSLFPGQGRTSFYERFASWKSTPDFARRYKEAEPTVGPKRSGKLSTMRLAGAPVRIVPTVTTDPIPSDLGVALVACSMLGQGKGCTLFQVLRESLGVSYRQESFLAPSRDGIRPIIAFASADASAPTSDFRKPLLAAVTLWTERDRARALTLSRAAVEMGLGIGQLYFAEERPLSESLDDRAFLAAYWRIKTGRVWNWQLVWPEMASVTLDQAKAYATAWIEKGEIIAVTPR